VNSAPSRPEPEPDFETASKSRHVAGAAGTPVTLVAHRIGPVGGMEQMLFSLIEGLLEKGFEVRVVAARCDLPTHPRLRRFRVPAPSRPFVLAYPWFFAVGSLVTWARRRGILNTTGAVVFNRADVSTVHYSHYGSHAKSDVLRASRPGRLYRWNASWSARMSRAAEGWCYRPRRTRRLVAVSRGVADELSQFLPAQPPPVDVIPNGVDRDVYAPDPDAREQTRRELDIGREEPVALFVGGDWERKGLAHAIGALRRAPQWRLVVVGPGDVSRYGDLAATAAPGRVRFVGEQADTKRFYAAADAFVFPTAYEAFPVALLEAASSGLALLVTPVSGAQELVIDGEQGFLIERDADAIAARLRELDADRQRMRTMGAAARTATSDYTWARVVDAYAELYAALRDGRDAPSSPVHGAG
jgi:glycosyltransferase involved in cell wall biosynthesis